MINGPTEGLKILLLSYLWTAYAGESLNSLGLQVSVEKLSQCSRAAVLVAKLEGSAPLAAGRVA